MDQLNQTWWTHINNASLFCRRIIDAMLNNQSVIVCLQKYMPWYETMHDLIERGVGVQSFMRPIRFKNESLLVERDPGKYLFDEFCSPELKRQFRPAKGYAKFLAESDEGCSLSHYYIWQRIINARQAEKWIKFVGEYLEQLDGRAGGVFLLEIYDESLLTKSHAIETISYAEMISTYDRFMFNMLASSDARVQGSLMKQYLAELVSTTVGNDIELSAECVRRGEQFLSSPRGVLDSIVETQQRSDGTAYRFDRSDEDLEQCLWTAQIKFVFPLLENFRRRFIESHWTEIEQCLPSQTGYGESILAPKEADIGFLHHNSYRLGLTSTEYDRLNMYREARNALAHMKTLELPELKKIFLDAQ